MTALRLTVIAVAACVVTLVALWAGPDALVTAAAAAEPGSAPETFACAPVSGEGTAGRRATDQSSPLACEMSTVDVAELPAVSTGRSPMVRGFAPRSEHLLGGAPPPRGPPDPGPI